MANIAIHFSDFFGLKNDELRKYGAFDVSLTFDVPVFIDPFRLYASDKPEYNQLHDRIIDYLRFLRDRCLRRTTITKGELREYFSFPEVKNTFMGFCKSGNTGSGLGAKFANALRDNLTKILFGEEQISEKSHLEKLCIICDGVGRDCISDFTTNLILDYLAQYTERFARQCLQPNQCDTFDIQHAVFDFEKGVWTSRKYYLPLWKQSYVLLVPTDLLTKDDTWISKEGLLKKIRYLPDTVGNEVLKAKLIDLLTVVLDETRRLSGKEINLMIKRFYQDNPEIVDWYIKKQEDNKQIAKDLAEAKVAEAISLYVTKVSIFAEHLAASGFYKISDTSITEARKRAQYFKHCIEDDDGYKLFYSDGDRKISEKQIQLAFHMVWYGTDKDVNREPNNGRGPVDYKVSKGCHDQCLVEFKLASNPKLEANLQHQLEIYKTANNTNAGIFIIVYANEKERIRMEAVLRRLGLYDSPDVITIDASPNKVSASKVGVGATKTL